MRINGLNGANIPASGMNMIELTDSVSKNIQNRIADAQKQLQELSSNKEMSIEEKMKKRQEIQQQITDLNNQLRQHQIEMRKEQQQAKSSSMDDMLGGSKRNVSKAENRSAGLSQASMKAMISADSAMAQAQVQGGVATKMEGRAGILESEIKLDSARGGSIETKQEELAEVQKKAAEVQSAQMNTLVDVNKEFEDAAKADSQADKEETGKAERNAEKSETADAEMATQNVSASVAEVAESVEASVSDTIAYTHVDMRL